MQPIVRIERRMDGDEASIVSAADVIVEPVVQTASRSRMCGDFFAEGFKFEPVFNEINFESGLSLNIFFVFLRLWSRVSFVWVLCGFTTVKSVFIFKSVALENP